LHQQWRSASSSGRMVDPGKLVAGLTSKDVEANPEIEDYFRSNFGNGGGIGDEEITSGITIPNELLREFGIEEKDNGIAAKEDRKYGDPRVDGGLGNAEQQSLNIRVLNTYLREEEGTRSSDRLRRSDIVPGLLFGSDPNLNILSSDSSSKILLKTKWAELQRELDRYHRRFESRVYDLNVFENEGDTEGTVHRVVPSSVQRHPVKGEIYCANFVRYHAGRPLKIPVTYINTEESPALKRDGFIIPVTKFVKCFVEQGVPIPDSLEVECTGLQVKDVIRMDRVIFPDGVKAIDRLNLDDFVIGPVRGGRSAAMADDEESVGAEGGGEATKTE
jgi:large subunit ribosomal protein L25